MKKISLFLLVFALFASSCSKEEENPISALENLQFTMLQEGNIVEVPQTLLDSDNEYAITAASHILLANAVRNMYSAFYTIPDGATKTTTPINSSNARIAAGTQYLVYTWGYNGFSYAYQLHATTTHYVLEIFLKFDEGSWNQLLYAAETKDGNKGELKFFDTFGTNELAWTFAWEKAGGFFKYSMFNTEGKKVYVEVSETTGAGFMDYYENNSLNLKLTWTAQGSGTWSYYSNGAVTSGNWD